jgi:hypothetical protein
MADAADLGINFQRFAEQAGVELRTFMQEFGQDLAERLIVNTPVDTGFLRGSWTAALNRPPALGVSTREDKGGMHTVATMNLVLSTMSPGDTVYMVNGARYARHVEYGTSKMAARGFVRKTVAQAPSIAQQTKARIKRGFGR